MKKLMLALCLSTSLVSAAAFADCQSDAAAKNLHGAAETSFIKKCEKTAKSASAGDSCRAQAADKKLHGAAQTSFVNKCIKDNTK